MNEQAPPPPKKLKLTLKLNVNSSSSSSGNGSSNSSSLPTSSAVTTPIVSSVEASPRKSAAANAADSLTDLLPSGMGNVKGRGRPKKNETGKEESLLVDVVGSSSSTATTNTTTNTTTTTITPSSDYIQDLKKLTLAMKSFRSRSWSLKKPVQMDFRNLAGFAIGLPAGLWCTEASEPASSHLPRPRKEVSASNLEKTASSATNSSLSSTSATNQVPFHAVCECGKVFDNRSKYRKHAKIHEKSPSTTNTTTKNVVIPASNPTISLKLKFNTAAKQ